MSAVIVIDCQLDFFSDEGIMNLDDDLIMRINKFVSSMNTMTLFIKSVYPKNSAPVSKTHASGKCCQQGNPLTEFHPQLAITGEVITKNYYDAFVNTNLMDILKKNKITKLYVCGVTLNTCVRHTVITASKSFETIVLRDCVATVNPDVFSREIIDIQKFAQTITSIETTYAREYVQNTNSRLIKNVLPNPVDIFESLMKEVIWHDMSHAGGTVSRKVGLQAEKSNGIEPIYRFPNDIEIPINCFTPTVLRIKNHLSELLGYNLNHAKIQLYENGKSFIGPHTDKTLDITIGTDIVNVSFGTTRKFELKHKSKKIDGIYMRHSVDLHDNSLFILDWETNKKFTHAVRKSDTTEPRISIVFRSISTFKRPDGTLFGQGSRKITDSIDPLVDAKLLLKAFGEENKREDYTYNELYGTGFISTDLSRINEHSLHKK
jgi:nicotinamidase-related amidase/alkylated DNA repair dioxygenase AlkB